VFFDELLQTQSPIQLANENQATIRSHSRSLEIDLQGSMERELKWLVLVLTHRDVYLQGVLTAFKPASTQMTAHTQRFVGGFQIGNVD
jgi:hypothetical protein